MFLAGNREFNLHLAGALSTYSVMSYGAKGNGSTDDTAAIQAAIDAAHDAGGGVVYLPVPDVFYNIGTALTVPETVSFVGQAPRSGGKTAFIGDSITQQGFVVSASGIVLENTGYSTWLRQESGQQLNADANVEFAENGATTNTIVSDYLEDACNSVAAKAIVAIGTNDTDGDTIPFATTIANLQTIWLSLVAAGIQPFAIPPLPRAHDDSQERNEHHRIVHWINENADQFNVIVADPSKYLIESSNADGEMRSGYTIGDDLHPSPTGAFFISKGVWEKISKYFPPRDKRIVSAGDVYDATYNPTGNLVTNSLMEGTSGTTGSGVTNDVADSWTVAPDTTSGLGTLAADCSKVARTDGQDGYWQQMVISGTPTANRIERLTQTVAASGKYSAGEVIYGVGEFELDTGHSNVRGIALALRDRNSGSSTVFTVIDGDQYSSDDFFIPDDGDTIKRTFETPKITVNGDPGSFVIEAYVYAQANVAISATVRFAGIGVRKVV